MSNKNISGNVYTLNNPAGTLTINGNLTTAVSSQIWQSGATGSTGWAGPGSFIGYSQVISKKKYHILGEDFEIDDFLVQSDVSTNLALINILGYEFYYDLERTNYIFPQQFKEAIEKRITVLKREKNIDEITRD